ncbi:hypothetical protein GQ43DRAFT_442150 [Delitschia confertaspora ATCC 74209]|uniref:Uncharacterized protein n=1 Tax=Delitschia confertaspora ATCC 74209 TaxID=1513339 RepID=A0A9P4MU79_9PLEO|nr:hypothetical protein GQ43DRAFT_442150 [Delitschia confertaspora ATCC 74209]
MSAQDFEAVLDAPDGNNTYGQLQQLILHIENVSSDHFLPNVAEKFFYAFCDRTLPLHKRRWIGIALHRFVQSSKLVVDHLQTISLSKLGQIILDQAEIEETKLVAGMVIRQLLKENIPYPALWPTDLVPNNVPQFPVNESQDWTSDFQGFLDDLAAIHILHPDNDSIILYTISVYAADGFKLVNPHDAAMLVLVEADFFSIIVPATSTQAAHFVDVPLCHIDSIETRTAILHDSQGIETEHEPWELVLTLKDRPWTYLANAAERRAVHVTIMLRNSTEAQEAQSSVAEAIQKLSAKRTKVKMSSSQVLVDVTLPPNSEPKEKGAVEPTEPKQPGKLVKPSNRSRPMIRKLALTNVAASNVQDEFDVPDSPPEGPKSIPQDKRLKAADTQKSRVTATSKSVQSRRNDAAESLKTQKSAQEPFGYEKLSEVANGKGPSHSQKRTHDIFEVPPDGNPEVFKRAKRRAAKSINYEESGAFEDPSDLEGSENSGGSQESMESEYGSTESDYEKTNPSKKAKSSSANKRPSRQNWNAKSKPESTPASKRKPNTRKEGSHDEEPHVSSISKKSGSGGRLSASQKSNKTGNRIAKAKVKLSAKGSINTRLSKSLKKSQVGGKEAELSEKMSSKQDSGRNTVQSEPESFDQESVPRSNPNLCGDKSMKQAPEQAEESEPDWTSLCQSSPNHAILAPKFSGSKILGFTQSPVSKNLSDTHVLNEQRTSPMLGVSQKRQVSPGDTPITPNPKRIKFAHDAEQEAAEDPDQGDRDNATGSPVTAAPSRVPGNAESPCPVNRHPHDEPVTTATKQPTAGESLNNLVASLFASDSEEIEAVQQRSQTRRKSSPNPRPNGGAPQETKTPHSTILQFGHPAVLNLSSNSKPAPASPHAESKAISGHVSSEEVEMDLERAIHQTEKIDPFKGRHNTQRFRANPFTRRLTGDSGARTVLSKACYTKGGTLT